MTSKIQSRGLYTYLVTPTGPIARVTFGGSDELSFRADISRADGWIRSQDVVVRDTDLRPGLVDRVERTLANARRARMVVQFERIPTPAGTAPRHVRTIAVVENLLDGVQPNADASVQLDLFG